MQRLLTGLLFVTVTAVMVFAGDNDFRRFAGTWKEDTSKTVNPVDPDSTLRYSQNSDGSLTATSISSVYKFETTIWVDGRPHQAKSTVWVNGKLDAERSKGDPTVTRTWTQKGPSAWEEKGFKNGKLLLWETLREVGPDNQTMAETETDFSANGRSTQGITVYQRTTNATGLVGTWKPVSTRDVTPDVLELSFDSDGTMHWHEFALDYRFSGKFDGKDYPVTGPAVNPKLRETLMKINDQAFEDVAKDGERPAQLGIWRLSPDGNTMHHTIVDLSSSTPAISIVYTRQVAQHKAE